MVGIFVAALLYVALVVYGQLVAAGGRRGEGQPGHRDTASTVRPRQLLFGKVVGIGLVGLAQLIVVGAVALIAVARTQVINVPNVGVTAVLGGLLWFVLGFVFYALIYAAAGSLVSSKRILPP